MIVGFAATISLVTAACDSVQTDAGGEALTTSEHLGGQPAHNCVHIDPLVAQAPIIPHELDFEGHPALLAALEDAGAFDDHGQYEPVFFRDGTSVSGLGSPAAGIQIAGVSGLAGGSLTTHQHIRGNGAFSMRLIHLFANDGGDAFVTMDQAVCAPAGPNPATCQLNTQFRVVDGAGAFANAAGKLRNRGTLDMSVEPWTLDLNVRGRICGEGLGG